MKVSSIKAFALALLLFFSFAYPSFAEDLYFAQSTAGDNSADSCANAKPLSGVAWGAGAGNVGAGDTLHLCGTIASAFSVGGSGSAGSPITIKFEDDAKFSAETWTNHSYIITVSGRSYIVIDGGTNGIIEATNNGTSLTYQNEFRGVGLDDAPNLEVKNLNIRKLYVHEVGDTLGVESYAVVLDYNGGVSSNTSVHNNTMTDVRFGVFWQTEIGGSNGSIYSNTIDNCDSGIKMGSRGTDSTWANMSIYGNSIGSHNMWDEPVTNPFHHNGIHVWNYNPDLASLTGLKIYGNYTHGTSGTYVTASIFLEGYATDVMVYNNITSGIPRNIYTKMATSNHIVANNTLLGSGYSLNTISGVTVTYKNNIEWGTAGRYTPGTTIDNSNNLTGIDPNFVSASDFRLQAGSLAIDNGADLSAYFLTDYAGNTRSGTWDIGAYEYGANTDSTPTAYSFTDQTGVALGSTGNSDNVTVAGIDNTTTLVLTGDASCKYSINGAAWATADDNVSLNDNVALQNVASGSYSTAISCTLNLGGVTDTWSRTTLAAALDPVTPRFRGASMSGGWR